MKCLLRKIAKWAGYVEPNPYDELFIGLLDEDQCGIGMSIRDKSGTYKQYIVSDLVYSFHGPDLRISCMVQRPNRDDWTNSEGLLSSFPSCGIGLQNGERNESCEAVLTSMVAQSERK